MGGEVVLDLVSHGRVSGVTRVLVTVTAPATFVRGLFAAGTFCLWRLPGRCVASHHHALFFYTPTQ